MAMRQFSSKCGLSDTCMGPQNFVGNKELPFFLGVGFLGAVFLAPENIIQVKLLDTENQDP
jgi:hypothetical protein